MNREFIIKELKSIIPSERIIVDAEHLEIYNKDKSVHLGTPCQVAVKVTTTQEVSSVAAWCNTHRIPLTVRGGGSGLAGGAVPHPSGIVLDMSLMNRVLHFDKDGFQITVEAGMITEELHNTVKKEGLMYPPDPSGKGWSHIGGNVATNASGPRTVKYGMTRDYVLNLEVVLADGTILNTGAPVLKHCSGYNLTQTIIGSEGTLAIVTAVTLKLIPHPTHDLLLLVPFIDAQEAMKAVNAIFLKGVEPSCLEFMDKNAVESSVNYTQDRFFDIHPDMQAYLLIEINGFQDDTLYQDAEKIQDVLDNYHIGDILVADNEAQKKQFWGVRRNISESIRLKKVFRKEDTVVPRAALTDFLAGIRTIEQQYGFTCICFGHAGDGNIHVNVMQEDVSEELKATWEQGIIELMLLVKRLHGYPSAEHGIGLVQKQYMPIFFTERHLELMRAVKKAFDPNNILNPEKIL